jgi:hypothetical protein
MQTVHRPAGIRDGTSKNRSINLKGGGGGGGGG